MFHLTESALVQVGKGLKDAKLPCSAGAFINDSGDARNTPAEPFRDAALAAGAEIAVHDPRVDPGLRPPDVPPGLSQDLEGVLSGADAVVVFAGHSTGGLCRSR
ncbi:MAG: UDP binding domain-containing protein [Methanoculleaceae archaeon]